MMAMVFRSLKYGLNERPSAHLTGPEYSILIKIRMLSDGLSIDSYWTRKIMSNEEDYFDIVNLIVHLELNFWPILHLDEKRGIAVIPLQSLSRASRLPM